MSFTNLLSLLLNEIHSLICAAFVFDELSLLIRKVPFLGHDAVFGVGLLVQLFADFGFEIFGLAASVCKISLQHRYLSWR